MQSRFPAILAALLALVALCAAVFGVAIFPWVSGPRLHGDDLDDGWMAVEVWANMESEAPANAEALLKAELAVERQAEALNALGETARSRTNAGVAEKDMPEEGRIALRALAQWDASGADLGDQTCGEALQPLHLLTTGRLLLAVAGKDASAPEIDRVLRLAAALRTSGDLRLVAIGYNLAEEIVSWVDARGGKPGPIFAELRPRTEEIFLAAARDAVCTWRKASATAAAGGMPELLKGLSAEAAPPWVRPMLKPDRELKMLQAYHVERLTSAWKDRTELGMLRSHLRLPPVADRPKSALVRGWIQDPAMVLDRGREVFDVYTAFLKAHHIERP